MTYDVLSGTLNLYTTLLLMMWFVLAFLIAK